MQPEAAENGRPKVTHRLCNNRLLLYGPAALILAGLGYGGFVRKALPDVEQVLNGAEIMAQVGAFEPADKAVADALAREPRNVHAKLIQGFIAERKEKHDEAIAAYREALAFGCDVDVELDVRLSIADLERRAKRFDRAQRELDALKTDRGTLWQIERLRGVVALDRGEIDEAVRRLQGALALDPENAELAALTASAHVEADDLERARRELSAHDPTVACKAPVWRRLARGFLEMGERTKARDALARYVESDKRAKTRLQSDPFWGALKDDGDFGALIR